MPEHRRTSASAHMWELQGEIKTNEMDNLESISTSQQEHLQNDKLADINRSQLGWTSEDPTFTFWSMKELLEPSLQITANVTDMSWSTDDVFSFAHNLPSCFAVCSILLSIPPIRKVLSKLVGVGSSGKIKSSERDASIKVDPRLVPVDVNVKRATRETHDYIHSLHSTHGDVFIDAQTAASHQPHTAAPPTIYSRSPILSEFVLTKNKLFQPVKCAASAFSCLDGYHSTKSRPCHDLVQPLAEGTVFHMQGDKWKTMKSCLSGAFVAGEEVAVDFAKAASEMIPGMLEPRLVEAQTFAYKLFIQGTLIQLFGPCLTLQQSCWEQFELAIRHFQLRYDYPAEGEEVDTAMNRGDFIMYADNILGPCAAAVDWALENDTMCPPSSAFVKMLEKGFDDRTELINTVANFVVAAAESPASAMAHALALIATKQDGSNGEVQRRMREEVTTCLSKHNGMMTKAFTRDLVYTEAVINEAMRLHSAATTVSREAVEDCDVPVSCKKPEGRQDVIRVSKGTKLNISIHASHLNEAVWGEDCTTFKPERWLAQSPAAQGGGLKFLPFSGGGRGCPGKALTIMWMKILFATILKDYEVETSKSSSITKHVAKFASWVPTGIDVTFTRCINTTIG